VVLLQKKKIENSRILEETKQAHLTREGSYGAISGDSSPLKEGLGRKKRKR
jgi:hypothetical protein